MPSALSPEKLAAWAQQQMLFNSRHHVRIYDLASINGYFFIVREHLPISLSDLLTAGGNMPISLAVRLAYQVLEALGDLHLHMTAEGMIQNRFHLDLRPSRVLLRRDKPYVKIYNGGLWQEIEKASPAKAELEGTARFLILPTGRRNSSGPILRAKDLLFSPTSIFSGHFFTKCSQGPPRSRHLLSANMKFSTANSTHPHRKCGGPKFPKP